jgi:hypothetical protein
MKVLDHKGFEIHVPTSGGKAGKGCNLTTSIQIRRSSAIVKQFRSKADRDNMIKAIGKAKAWIDDHVAHFGAMADFLKARHPHRHSDLDVMPLDI